MPFIVNGFNCTRHSASPSSSRFNNVQHSYTVNDPLSEILTPGYFPSDFGVDGDVPVTNDTIFIVGNDGLASVIITNPATGAISTFYQTSTTGDAILNSLTISQTSTPPGGSQLNFYADAVPLTLPIDGFSDTTSTQAYATRIGNTVILYVQAFNGTFSGTHAGIFLALPSWLSLSGSSSLVPNQIVGASYNGIGNVVNVRIDSDLGVIIDPGNSLYQFLTGDSVGVNDISIQYMLA